MPSVELSRSSSERVRLWAGLPSPIMTYICTGTRLMQPQLRGDRSQLCVRPREVRAVDHEAGVAPVMHCCDTRHDDRLGASCCSWLPCSACAGLWPSARRHGDHLRLTDMTTSRLKAGGDARCPARGQVQASRAGAGTARRGWLQVRGRAKRGPDRGIYRQEGVDLAVADIRCGL
jgi:hypothetical protein